MRLLWEEKAWNEYCEWQTEDKKTLKRINAIIKDIQRGSYDGIGKPEPLKDNLSGWWSRRIDETNRIVTVQMAHLLDRKSRSRSIGCPSDVEIGA